MSTYESFVESVDLQSEERFLRGVSAQSEKVAAFLSEHRRRCDLVAALDEQNDILRRQIDAMAADNSAQAKQASVRLEDLDYRLEKALEDLDKTVTESGKYKEYVSQLETNNTYLKKQSEQNEILILESKAKIESLRESAKRTELALDELISQTERITVPAGVCKSLNLTITRQVEGFEDLAREVEILRSENKNLLDKIADLQMAKQRTDKKVDFVKQRKLDDEEEQLQMAVGIKDELDMVRELTATQETLIDSLQVDLETLREENAYLTERVKKRGIQLEYNSN